MTDCHLQDKSKKLHQKYKQSTHAQMGFLTVNGQLMTYDEYKHLVNLYRAHGILQFMKLYNVHKDKQIAP